MDDFSSANAQELASRSTILVITESIVFIVLMILASIGNLLVCWAIYNNTRLRTIPNIFIASLAVSDILQSTLSMPLTSGTLATGNWIYGRKVCLFQGIITLCLGMVSLQTLAFISVNRYLLIVRQKLYKKVFTAFRTRAMLVIIWSSSLFVALLPLFISSADINFSPGRASCMYSFESSMPFTFAIGFLFIGTPMGVMMVCYSKVFYEVRKNQKRVAQMRGTRNNSTMGANVEEVRITNNILVVYAGFMMCWTPIGVIDLTDAARGVQAFQRQIYLFDMCLIYISSTLNPWIYGVMNRRFRQEYKKALFCKKYSSMGAGQSDATRSGINTQNPQIITVESVA